MWRWHYWHGWGHCTLVYEFTVCHILFKKFNHKRYYKNCFFPFLKAFILKNAEAHFGKHEGIKQELFKAQNLSFDKNLEAHWNLGMLIKIKHFEEFRQNHCVLRNGTKFILHKQAT